MRRNAIGLLAGLAASTALLTLAPLPTQAATWVPLQGNVRTGNGTPVCALVLANGQYMFSCDGNGTYSLNVPLDDQGQVTLFAFADGFAPYRLTAAPASLPAVVQTRTADPDSPLIFMGWDMACATNNWVRLSGEIESEAGEPLCALVLANGQHMFSCGDSQGRYDLTVPVDENNNITLFGFADGFQPYSEIFVSPGCGTNSGSSTLWVHVNYLGEYVNSLCFYGGALPMTAHMRLVDAEGRELEIEPYGCIDSGPNEVACGSLNGGTWRNYSAWEIDRIAKTAPTPDTVCGESRCVPGWYRVELPTGFVPVEYVAACSIYLPFEIP